MCKTDLTKRDFTWLDLTRSETWTLKKPDKNSPTEVAHETKLDMEQRKHEDYINQTQESACHESANEKWDIWLKQPMKTWHRNKEAHGGKQEDKAKILNNRHDN